MMKQLTVVVAERSIGVVRSSGRNWEQESVCIRPRELVQPFAGGGVDTGDGVLAAMLTSEGQDGSTEGV